MMPALGTLVSVQNCDLGNKQTEGNGRKWRGKEGKKIKHSEMEEVDVQSIQKHSAKRERPSELRNEI
jgi:hypothetical protein